MLQIAPLATYKIGIIPQKCPKVNIIGLIISVCVICVHLLSVGKAYKVVQSLDSAYLCLSVSDLRNFLSLRN